MPKIQRKSTKNLQQQRKEVVIDLMRKSLGNITYTCTEAKIDRKTYYNWLEQDEKFREAIENLDFDEMKVDIAELGMIGLAKEKNFQACKFILEKKGFKRGYFERSDNVQVNIQNNSITNVKKLWEDIEKEMIEDG